MADSAGLERLGRGCARRPWVVIVVWLVVLAGTVVADRVWGGTYSDDFTLPGTESGQGSDLLVGHGVAASAYSARLVFQDDDGLAAQDDAVDQAVADVADVEHVLAVSDLVAAPDGTVGYVTVQFDGNPGAFGSTFVDDVDAAVEPARDAGVDVDYTGALGQAAEPAPDDRRSEGIGIAVAVVVLLVAFGSVLAAVLPIASSVIGVLAALSLLGLLAAGVDFATASPTLAAMLGLGVGIDYALFLTTRHRQRLLDGADPVAAAGRTVATSGRSVLIAASTVVIALSGLWATRIGFIGKLGLAATVAVVVAGVAAVTLVPALLGLAGRRIDRLRVRTPVAEESGDGSASGWRRYALALDRHPWRYLLAGVLVAGILAVPTLSLRLGHVDDGASAQGSTTREAYDALAAGFGAGANGQFTVVVEVGDGDDGATIGANLQSAIAGTDGVEAVTDFTPSQDGALQVATVTPSTRPQDAATDDLLHTLRDDTIAPLLAGSNTTAYITGLTAAQLDFRDLVAERLPEIIAIVVGAAFVVLLLSFRSPVLAVKAALLNLLSIAAAYGVVVAVFQWGWGSSLLGVDQPVPIESYVPMIMFAIVFGLSMDYEVFLLSRVREAWLATGENHGSVATGLAVTARVISSAALIMMSVFFAFVAADDVVIKMLAVGLGFSVLIDATVIRLLVVPSAMFLLGDRCWWLPRWLDRMLPHLEPEPDLSRSGASGR
ncbi:MMPL family transporter [Jiangella alkaliphila]|uniref:Putative drug exporter of the RND superfamily n=1 Tax=Jiangella alkaliphila TaxID=419479 RepID=A0A1H2KU06_9ACTN|nr:MMPL family transporter [Jiangella alkaliphila]SDU72035.1 putative drug exporter of the RND superfamily [Jiangella alkaliphila]